MFTARCCNADTLSLTCRNASSAFGQVNTFPRCRTPKTKKQRCLQSRKRRTESEGLWTLSIGRRRQCIKIRDYIVCADEQSVATCCRATRLFVTVAGLVVFSLTNKPLQGSNGIELRLPLLGLILVIWFHIRVRLLCSKEKYPLVSEPRSIYVWIHPRINHGSTAEACVDDWRLVLIFFFSFVCKKVKDAFMFPEILQFYRKQDQLDSARHKHKSQRRLTCKWYRCKWACSYANLIDHRDVRTVTKLQILSQSATAGNKKAS